jgi:hypothetical protein
MCFFPMLMSNDNFVVMNVATAELLKAFITDVFNMANEMSVVDAKSCEKLTLLCERFADAPVLIEKYNHFHKRRKKIRKITGHA